MSDNLDGRRPVKETKHIKISGGGEWFNSVCTFDGKPVEVVGMSIDVSVDEASTVTLVVPAACVQFDIQSPAEDTVYVRDTA